MKTEIDLSAIDWALIQLGDATARQIADKTGLETKDVTRALNAMLKSATVEHEKRGSEYVYWLTTTATTKPTAKPRAAAVAVHAALEGGTDPAPDLAEQLRQAHAERLAMSQTIIAICCAIGRDPGQTTTAELPQALRDYIDGQIEREKAEHAGAIADIRAAIGDDGRLPLSEIAGKIKEALTALGLDSYVLDVIRNTLASHAADLVPDCGAITTEPEAIRIMAQLIDTQHAHLLAQSAQLDAQAADLESATRLHLACNGLTNDLMEPAGPFYDQAQGLRAAAMLIDAQQAHIKQLEEHVGELRSRVEAQILAGHQSASSSARLLTEVHEVLSSGWPHAYDFNPSGRTTLQLAQKIGSDFKLLYDGYEENKARREIPDAYLVARRDWKNHVSRHKSPEAAERAATSALRAGAGQADIYAVKRIAIGKRRPVIESV